MWKRKTIGKKTKSARSKGIKARGEWLQGRHWCGHGFRGWIVRSHGLTFCNLCGKERRI